MDWRHSVPVKSRYEFTSGGLVDLTEACCYYETDCLLPHIKQVDGKVYQSSNVNIHGTNYRKGQCLIVDVNPAVDNTPRMVKIIDIFAGTEDVVFGCTDLVVNSFHSHSNSYLVSESPITPKLLRYRSLYDYHPVSLHKCFKSNCAFNHVCLRHRLEYNNYAACLDFGTCQ